MAKLKEQFPIAGLLCVVNQLPDATVYRIEEYLSGHVVRLTYVVGSGVNTRRVGGGDMYGSMIYIPSKEQLENALLLTHDEIC